MNLGEMENTVLAETQQPGVDFIAGSPDWGLLNNAILSQGLVDAFINQGYRKLMEDCADIEPFVVQVQQNSVALPANPAPGNTTGWQYPILPVDGNTYPDCQAVVQIGYSPKGLLYTKWYERAVEFVSHEQWLGKNGYGYMQVFSTANLPSVVCVDDDRAHIDIYPASAIAGDVIFVRYVPLPTKGAPLCPTLVLPTDTPKLPNGNAHNAIVAFANSRAWMKLRAPQQALAEMQKYEKFAMSFKVNYRRTSHASDLRVRTSSFDPIGIADDL